MLNPVRGHGGLQSDKAVNQTEGGGITGEDKDEESESLYSDNGASGTFNANVKK